VKIRSPWFTTLALALVAWLSLLGAFLPDAPPDVHAQTRGSVSSSMDARARWESLSAEERTQVQRRFEQLQRMDSTERERLARRAERWKREEGRVLARLSERDQKRLMRHAPEKRQQLIAEMVRNEQRDAGLRLEAKLPAKTREWLANAPPEQRRKRLEQFRRQTREKISARAVEELVMALGMGEKEIARLERLPIEERMGHVLRLRKELMHKQVSEDGLPEGLTRDRWDALEALPPEEYFIEVLRLRREGLFADVRPVGTRERPERARKSALSRDLRRALHIDPEELLGMGDLSHAERRSRIGALRRERVVSVLRRRDVLDEAQIERLGDLSDRELVSRVRAVVNEGGGPGRRPGGGRGPGPRGGADD